MPSFSSLIGLLNVGSRLTGPFAAVRPSKRGVCPSLRIVFACPYGDLSCTVGLAGPFVHQSGVGLVPADRVTKAVPQNAVQERASTGLQLSAFAAPCLASVVSWRVSQGERERVVLSAVSLSYRNAFGSGVVLRTTPKRRKAPINAPAFRRVTTQTAVSGFAMRLYAGTRSLPSG